MKEKGKKLSTESYKGVRDFYPEDMSIENYIFSVWRKSCESFGFQEYNASILEPAELYRAKSGEEIVNEQTYTFTDRGDREVTLRPEMTPTVARMVAARKRELAFPLRWYSIPNVFRYERPQRGRLREHFQLNVDMFGIDSIQADIELISLAANIMKNFKAKDTDYEIRISSRRLLNAVFSEWYELDENKAHALQKLIDKKSKMDAEIFQGEAEKIVGRAFEFLNLSEENELHEEALAIPAIRDAKNELDAVIDSLSKKGIVNVKYDPELIRGFDYYTGIIFEVFDMHPDNNRSLFGGGRYDELLSLFGNDEVAATGFGMGDVALLNFLEVHKLLPKFKPSADIYISIIGEERDYAEKVANDMRENSANVILDITMKSLGDQMKIADKQEIPYVAVIGEDEIKNKSFMIKKLQSGDTVSISNQEELKDFIKNIK